MVNKTWRRIRAQLTQELAMDPKYLAPPEALIDREPKASTISPLCSSSLTSPLRMLRWQGGSLCRGALIWSRSSARRGCLSVETMEWDCLRASSSSRTRLQRTDIFSWSSCVDASTKLRECEETGGMVRGEYGPTDCLVPLSKNLKGGSDYVEEGGEGRTKMTYRPDRSRRNRA